MTATIHRINLRFVSAYLIAEDNGLTLIDTGTGGSYRAILQKITDIGRQPSDLKRILITHCDADHVGSAAALKAATGARLYASKIEAEALARGTLSRPARASGVLKLLFALTAPLMKIKPVTADEIVAGGDELPVLGGLQVVATPGHTPDHVSFFAPKEQALFAGDSMVATKNGLRFTNGPVTWNYAVGVESVRKQAELGATTVYCGHGPVVEHAVTAFPAL